MRTSWLGAMLTVVAFVGLDLALTGRHRLTPVFMTPAIGLILIASLAIARFARNPALVRAGRFATIGFVVVAASLNAINLVVVVDDVLFHSTDISPISLVLTSLALWAANVLAFSLLYWSLDGGGPDVRASDAPGYPDFNFPAYADPSLVRPGWRPTFIDYLFIGFTTSTAFGPVEAMPLTPRAKGLMILQSVISLVTLIVVAARAVGVIPG